MTEPQNAPPGTQSASNSPQWIANLRKGDQVNAATYLVEISNFKQTRNQKYFIQMSLRDKTGSLRSIKWDADEALYTSISVDDFVRINGRVEEYQNNRQIIVDHIEKLPSRDFAYEDFLPASHRDREEMVSELRDIIESLGNVQLKGLLQEFISDDEILFALSRCPAGKSLHHAFIGGLLEHILSLCKLARHLASNYSRLNLDMLLAGCILHDIGKCRELSFKKNFSYTDEGQLIGHIGIGLLMINEKAGKLPGFPAELLLQLQHIIASHHGLLEYGALKRPMTPAALAFHYLDNLDSKMGTLDAVENEMSANLQARSPGSSAWSDDKPHLERKLFFPGKEAD